MCQSSPKFCCQHRFAGTGWTFDDNYQLLSGDCESVRQICTGEVVKWKPATSYALIRHPRLAELKKHVEYFAEFPHFLYSGGTFDFDARRLIPLPPDWVPGLISVPYGGVHIPLLRVEHQVTMALKYNLTQETVMQYLHFVYVRLKPLI